MKVPVNNLKGRRVYQFILDEKTGKIEDISDSFDYVKVVRCKDCKHFLKARNEDEYDSCAILFEMQDIPLETDEGKYCAWAERKTND